MEVQQRVLPVGLFRDPRMLSPTSNEGEAINLEESRASSRIKQISCGLRQREHANGVRTIK